MQAPITSHLDYCHRLLSGIGDGHLVTLKSTLLPEFYQMSTPAWNLSVALCGLLTTLDKVQASCLHKMYLSPDPIPAEPFFLHYALATPVSHSSLLSCLLCLECPSFPSAPSHPLRLTARITSSRKHVLTTLYSTRKLNIYITVISTRYNCLFMPRCSLLGCKLLKERDHVLLIFAITLLSESWQYFVHRVLNLTQSHTV